MDFDYVKVSKWSLRTRGKNPESIAVCIAENRIIATEYFAQVKRLTVAQLLEIFDVEKIVSKA